MSWSTILWLVGAVGFGGLVWIALFMTGVLPILLSTRIGKVAAGIFTLGIAIVVAYFTAVGQGEAKERARREKEDERFLDDAARRRETIRRLPDDDLDDRLRDGTETKPKGDR